MRNYTEYLDNVYTQLRGQVQGGWLAPAKIPNTLRCGFKMFTMGLNVLACGAN